MHHRDLRTEALPSIFKDHQIEENCCSAITPAESSIGGAPTISTDTPRSAWLIRISTSDVCIIAFRAPDAWVDVVERFSNENNKTLNVYMRWVTFILSLLNSPRVNINFRCICGMKMSSCWKI
ncbi:hypothetical protein Bca4012_037161 [Brassica carinata]